MAVTVAVACCAAVASSRFCRSMAGSRKRLADQRIAAEGMAVASMTSVSFHENVRATVKHARKRKSSKARYPSVCDVASCSSRI